MDRRMNLIFLLFSIYLLYFLSFPPTSLAQVTFKKLCGGSNWDYGYWVQQTSDGGYVITGQTGPGTSTDIYLAKTDEMGNMLWKRLYGGSQIDVAYSVQQTSDKGYVIAGYTFSYGAGEKDIYVIKTDAFGDTLWTRTYGGQDYEEGYSVRQTSDGGYILAGRTSSYGAGSSDIYLIKTDAFGDTLWTKTIGGPHHDAGEAIQETSDGNYIATGYVSFDPLIHIAFLLKLDGVGNLLWIRYFAGLGRSYGYAVQHTTDWGYVIIGDTDTLRNGIDFYMVKTDSLGLLEWEKTYDNSSIEWGATGHQTSDGGYILIGSAETSGGEESDAYLIKTDSKGEIIWDRYYGGTYYDHGCSVQQTSDGGYVFTGDSQSFSFRNSDAYLVKVDAEGGWGIAVDSTMTALP